MSDQNHDIEKYRKGLLTKAQIHALEKKSLSDPFLAEALEGAEQISADDFSFDVNELNQKITNKKRNWWPLGIAASFLLLATVAFLIYNSTSVPLQQKLTLAKSESAKAKESVKTDSVKNFKGTEKLLAIQKATPNQITKNTYKLDSPPLLSVAPNQGLNPQPLNLEDSSKATEAILSAPLETMKEEEKSVAQPIVADVRKREEDTDKPIVRSKAKITNLSSLEAFRVITGNVFSSEDGSPLPGVSIIVPGTDYGFVTDADGNYIVKIPENTTELSFSFIGLQTQVVKLDNNQPTVNVQMSADATQLSEVVVVGYGLADKEENDETVPVHIANPIGGRRAYNKYLEKSLRYPEIAIQNKVEGKVTVQFIVDLSGKLTDFAIIRSLGYGCDEEVIRLVKEGPKWNPSMQAEIPIESTVRVRVKFKLPK